LSGQAEPTSKLVRALVARHADLADIEIVHLLTLGDAPYAQKDLINHFTVNIFFIEQNVRHIIQKDWEGIPLYSCPTFRVYSRQDSCR
jgi:hypothetical protein